MLKYFALLFCLVAMVQIVSGQHDLIRIYDSEDRFFQYTGSSMIEHNDKYYVLGIVIDTFLPTTERNIQITAFDEEGKVLSVAVWDNAEIDGENMLTAQQYIHFHNGYMYIPYASSNQDCIVKIDEELSGDFELVACDGSLGDPKSRNTVSSSLHSQGKIQIVHSAITMGAISDFFYISEFDLDNPAGYQAKEIRPSIFGRYLPQRLFNYGQDSIMVIGGYGDQSPENTEDHRFSTFISWLDGELNLKSTDLIGTDYLGNSRSMNAFVDDDCVVFSMNRLDMENYVANQDLATYSVIKKIDLTTNEILWETPVDTSVFSRRPSIISDIEFSHDQDGYIWSGWGYESTTNAITIKYGKISKNGIMLWDHEIIDDYLPTNLYTEDVLATSDGNYILVGFRSDKSDQDDYDTVVQTFLMKFDEQGNVLDFRTLVDESYEEPFSINPNPAREEFTIDIPHYGVKHIFLTDLEGRFANRVPCDTMDCVVDISGLAAGTYVVFVADDSGNYLGRQKVVVVR